MMNEQTIDRRTFVAAAGVAAATPPALAHAARALPLPSAETMQNEPLYRISLAQWSLNRSFRSDQLHPLDFPKTAKEEFGIDAVEYVNGCFGWHYDDLSYVDELKTRCEDLGVKSLLIMVDGEGALGDADEAKRKRAVQNHHKYVEAAKTLGCHSIRVNAQSSGSYEEQQQRAADGLRALTEFGATHGINVIVENHGGLSSNGEWLAGVMRMVDHPRCGTLPDFGNFCLDWSRRDDPDAWYDRYKGVKELMPFAKAVSAKSHEFDDEGNETSTDYRRMMKIVLDAGYRGHVGIEFEGRAHSEFEGIAMTKALLERVRGELAASFGDGAAQ